jgi:hypothetical protein
MLKYEYVGPVDQIDTIVDGRTYTVKRGDVLEVSPYASRMLDLQPSNWQPVKPDKKTKETD